MSSNVPGSFPDVIDSSLMTDWRNCRRKTKLERIDHWKPVTPNVHLHAGAAFAKGLEVARVAFYEQGADEEKAIALGIGALLTHYGAFDCPEDSAKSASRMAGALEFYFHSYPMSTDKAKPHTLPSGKKGIEFSFLEPIDLRHPETGDPILYSGRFDMICDYAGGVFGEDDKTTSSLGPTWSRQWDLRSQFTAYTWAAKRVGIPLRGFLIRGVSILKTKYDTQEAITYRPQWMIDEWYKGLLHDVREMIEAWKTGYWRPNFDDSCNLFGGCVFKQCCTSESPVRWLEQSFERRHWDPVTRVETRFEEAALPSAEEDGLSVPEVH